MPSRLTYPGVYVEEKQSGVRTITGVSTSTALLIGMTKLGPIGEAVRVRSIDQFHARFGDYPAYGEMGPQVGQFFRNGGTDAIIVRQANGAQSATVTLRDQTQSTGSEVLLVSASDAGLLGDTIRVVVDYNTPTPEVTFNLTLYRDVTDPSTGARRQEGREFYGNLTMQPGLPNNAIDVVNGSSQLVSLQAGAGFDPSAPGDGYSLAGLLLEDANEYVTIDTLLPPGTLAAKNNYTIQVSANGAAPVLVTLPSTLDHANFGLWLVALRAAIAGALLNRGIPDADVTSPATSITVDGTDYNLINIQLADGTVLVSSGGTGDATGALNWGSAAGGLEVGAFAHRRPAPSGFVTLLHGSGSATFGQNSNRTRIESLGSQRRSDLSTVTFDVGAGTTYPGAPAYEGTIGTSTLFEGSAAAGRLSFRNIQENLDAMVGALRSNTDLANSWAVERHGFRLYFRPSDAPANAGGNAELTSSAFDVSGTSSIARATFSQNVAAYTMGASGSGGRQTPGDPGLDGNHPVLSDYEATYIAIGNDIDRLYFNLMLLPRGEDQADSERDGLWPSASAFCQRFRSFLILDPNENWTDPDSAVSGIPGRRIGVAGNHAAVYWPRIVVPTDGQNRTIDPCGTVAGIMARTDVRRGVWKAPAGIEASTLGTVALESLVNDSGNGVTNPNAINTLRQFPSGSVIWGARTLAGFDNSGEDDYKYVPVRRFALFIEESLYRGLKFAVFEPNAEPLWAQIRVAAGAFMSNLFRQDAFAGEKKSDAYQVLCDATTTSQNDVNLGRVNVIVKFAPLKPAEFVVLTIQQLAGQVQT